MKQVIHLGTEPIVLVYPDNIEEIDVEEVTKIDHSNLYGDSVTMPYLLNIVSTLLAKAEEMFETSKKKRNHLKGSLEIDFRAEASKKEGKFTIMHKGSKVSIKMTDKSIESAIMANEEYQEKMSEEIKCMRMFKTLLGFYQALKDKSNKLDIYLPKVTPKEFYNELTEGKINGILIKKPR